MFKTFLKRSYIYLLLALFYIPLIVAMIFSFSKDAGKRGDMQPIFVPTGEGWSQLSNDPKVFWSLMNSLWIALVVAAIVVVLSLITTFGLWRQKNKLAKPLVNGTSSIPLINPDIITAISLSLSFGAMFGLVSTRGESYFRLIAAHVAMILPFAITLMLPRSDKFKMSLFEASKDLGYNSIETWFKTYFRHMVPVAIASFVIAIVLSLDDFIVGRIVFGKFTRQDLLLGKEMYSNKLRPWVLALGTIMLMITILSTTIFAFVLARKDRKMRKVKR